MSSPQRLSVGKALVGLALILPTPGTGALAESSRGKTVITSPQFGVSMMPTLGSFVTAGRAGDGERGLRVTGQMRLQPTQGADLMVGLGYESRAGSWADYFGYGGQYLECGGKQGYQRQVSLAYVLTPIRLRLFPRSSRVRPFLMFGAEVGYLLNAQESGRNRCTGSELPSREVRAGLNAGVAEVTVGIGVAAPVAGRSTFIQVNLIEAASPLQPFAVGFEGSWPKVRSRVWGLEFGTWF